MCVCLCVCQGEFAFFSRTEDGVMRLVEYVHTVYKYSNWHIDRHTHTHKIIMQEFPWFVETETTSAHAFL